MATTETTAKKPSGIEQGAPLGEKAMKGVLFVLGITEKAAPVRNCAGARMLNGKGTGMVRQIPGAEARRRAPKIGQRTLGAIARR